MRPRCPLCHKDSDLIFDSRGKAISCLCGWTTLWDFQSNEEIKMSIWSELKEQRARELKAEIIIKLQAENKVLEMELDLKSDKVTEQAMEISALKEIRDKLLEALKDLDSSLYPKHSTEEVFIPATSYHDGYSIQIDKLIEAAEALKEKETKCRQKKKR